MSSGIKKRIAALLAKTVARGCTEAEAIAAAAKAAELMREYGIAESDLTIDEQSAKSRSVGRSARDQLWGVVGHCTNTVSIFDAGNSTTDRRLVFVGYAPGPEIATYLFQVLNRAIDVAIADFKNSTFYRRRRTTTTKRKAVEDFTIAMTWRLMARLCELFAGSTDPVKADAASRALAHRYPDSVDVGRRPVDIRFSEAVWAGAQAGNGVALNHGISGAEETRLIGRGA
jgi:hypothetical protein